MESGLKKHKGLEECMYKTDRLSELPDEVLVHILSFLPTLDAVRTVLLRRFGNLWTLVPSLYFSDKEIHSKVTDMSVISLFSLFVSNVLMHQKRPTIRRLVLWIKAVGNWKRAERAVAEIIIDMCVRFALSREAKTLILEFDRSRRFPLPGSIFTSQSIVVLKLESCCIQLPSRVHMGSLQTLALYHVDLKAGDFNEVLSGCPSLQELLIMNAKGFDELSFSAPSIERLALADRGSILLWTINCPNLKKLCMSVNVDSVEVVNVPSVCEVTIGAFYHDIVVPMDAYQFKRFLEELQNAKVVIFMMEAGLHLNILPMINLSFPLNRWKCLVLYWSSQDPRIAGICGLIRSSSYLEELIIYVHRGKTLFSKEVFVFRTSRDSDLFSREAASPCVIAGLKVVTIHGYGCEKYCEALLRLAEFLLMRAVNLDKLVIFSNQRSQSTSTREQFMRQLLDFPKASAKARIIFE